jgi:putative ABC transport system ATP-binding protein
MSLRTSTHSTATHSTAMPNPSTIPAKHPLQTRDLTRRFDLGDHSVTALNGVNFEARAGERVAIMGPSGCGKSSLLALLGGLDSPTSGQVLIEGQDLGAMTEHERVELRRGGLGYIFQGHHLLPALSVLDNVEYPLLVAGISKTERRERALTVLYEVGLSDKINALPDELSGGQQQRVGIARCLVTQPRIVLADEPTGNLDTQTTSAILELLCDTALKRGMTLVMVTHDPVVAGFAERIVRLRDGKIEMTS